MRDADSSFFMKTMIKIMHGMLARSTVMGASTLVHGIIPELDTNVHGKFLMDCQVWP